MGSGTEEGQGEGERVFTFAKVKSVCELPPVLSDNFCKLEIRKLGYSGDNRG